MHVGWATFLLISSTLCFLFICHGQPFNGAGDVVALLQQEIAWMFVGRLKCGLQRFGGGAIFSELNRYSTCTRREVRSLVLMGNV